MSLKQEMQTGMLCGATTNAVSSNITLNVSRGRMLPILCKENVC